MSGPIDPPEPGFVPAPDGQSGFVPVPDGMAQSATDRDWARSRLERRRKLGDSVVAYLVINSFLIGIWAVIGQGYFWPGWALAGWGVALILEIWSLFSHRPITNADIDREMRKGS